jgi:hypothetical protein
MIWTKEMLIKIMKPAYMFSELEEITRIPAINISRAARRLAERGILNHNNLKKRKARITPEDAEMILKEVKPSPGNPGRKKE